MEINALCYFFLLYEYVFSFNYNFPVHADHFPNNSRPQNIVFFLLFDTIFPEHGLNTQFLCVCVCVFVVFL